MVLGAFGSVGAPLLRELLRELDGEAEGFAVLGVGAGTATLTLEEHRGSQHTPWILEKTLPLLSLVTPATCRSITVGQIAMSMIATAMAPPAGRARGHYRDMMDMIRSPGTAQPTLLAGLAHCR